MWWIINANKKNVPTCEFIRKNWKEMFSKKKEKNLKVLDFSNLMHYFFRFFQKTGDWRTDKETALLKSFVLYFKHSGFSK